MKFRQREAEPPTVEAVQFVFPEWVKMIRAVRHELMEWHLRSGEWLVKHHDDRIERMTDAEFRAKYEAVVEPSPAPASPSRSNHNNREGKEVEINSASPGTVH